MHHKTRPRTSPWINFSPNVIINSIEWHYLIELNQKERASQAVPLWVLSQQQIAE
jgi:hypothetical protein